MATLEHPSIQYHQSLAEDWERRYQKRAFAERERLFAHYLDGVQLEQQRWLDAGCGTGRLARLLARKGCHVQGVDASPAMLEVAAGIAKNEGLEDKLTFQQIETVERLPFASGIFDGILCSSVLEYVDNPRHCLAEFARTLKRGGLLLVTTPNRQSLLRQALVLTHRVSQVLLYPWPPYLDVSRHEYCGEGLRRMLSEYDLVMLSMTVFGGPFPHWLQRRRFAGSLLLAVARKWESTIAWTT